MFRPRALQAFFVPLATRRTFSTTRAAQDVAKVALVGNVAIPPEQIVAPSGNAFLKYTVVTGAGRGETRRSTFWRIAVFDDRQKEIVQNLGKGSLVYVDADIEMKPYEDDNGKKHHYVNLFQRNVNILIRRNPEAAAEGEGGEGEGTGAEGGEGNTEGQTTQ